MAVIHCVYDIYDTRPWKVLGEGPQLAGTEPSGEANFNEGQAKPFTAEDVRFTTKGGTIYAIVMGAPKSAVSIKSLGKNANLIETQIAAISLVGSDEKLTWAQTAEALVIEAPRTQPNEIAMVFKLTPRR